MIEPTDEMYNAFRASLAEGNGYWNSLRAVLAIVDRDFETRRRISRPPDGPCPYCSTSLQEQCPWHWRIREPDTTP